jgi:hypothetical protein
MDHARPMKMTATMNSCRSVFDRSASDAEHRQKFLFPASPGFSGHFPATKQVFGIFPPNAPPTGM